MCANYTGNGNAPAQPLGRNFHGHLPNVGQHGQPHSSATLRPTWPEVVVHWGLHLLQVQRLPLQRCSRILLPIEGQGANHACQCDWLSLQGKLTCFSDDTSNRPFSAADRVSEDK